MASPSGRASLHAPVHVRNTHRSPGVERGPDAGSATLALDAASSEHPRLDAAQRRRLARLRREAARAGRAPPSTVRRRPSRRWGWWAWPLRLAGLALLPFFALVGTGAWAHHVRDLAPWASVALGAAAATAVLTLYGVRISRALTGRFRVRTIAIRLALPVVLLYCGYVALTLSSANAKSDDVRAYYTSLHPLFRLALGTAVILDRDLVVTDVQRVPDDYVRMGLPVREASLHYRQSSGYVHAVDLRTLGRAEWRTTLLSSYFRLLGFRTLRHVGTADHLHVSLSVR